MSSKLKDSFKSQIIKINDKEVEKWICLVKIGDKVCNKEIAKNLNFVFYLLFFHYFLISC